MQCEWAVRVERAADLDSFPRRLGETGALPTTEWDAVRRRAGELLARQFGPAPMRRLYFGSEYCPLLAPRPAELRWARAMARACGMQLTLVTSYLTEIGLARLRPLLDILAAGNEGAEVLVNDWGAVRLLHRAYPELTPVLGRLLAKSLRDPRLALPGAHARFTERAWAFAGAAGVSSDLYARHLREQGVAMISLDVVPQGLQADLRAAGLAGALHLPFSHVASGRLCLAANPHAGPAEKFLPASACRRECQQLVLEMQHNSVPLQLFQRGNTVVFLHTEALVADIRARAAALGFSRFVYEWG